MWRRAWSTVILLLMVIVFSTWITSMGMDQAAVVDALTGVKTMPFILAMITVLSITFDFLTLLIPSLKYHDIAVLMALRQPPFFKKAQALFHIAKFNLLLFMIMRFFVLILAGWSASLVLIVLLQLLVLIGSLPIICAFSSSKTTVLCVVAVTGVRLIAMGVYLIH